MPEKKKFMERIGTRMFGINNDLKNNPNTIKANETAPEMGFSLAIKDPKRYHMSFSKRRKMFNPKILISMWREINKAKKTLDKNLPEAQQEASKEFYLELKKYAESLRINIGYTKLPQEYIFKDQAVLFDNVIVLSMEMDKEKIDNAPSLETGRMVVETYHELGVRANKIAEFLRKKGFAAQACHPLGGAISYTPLAMLAGMGWHGRHGLIITPDFGPRHRLAAVLTNITNLPIIEKNEHRWIEDYCANCGRCIKTCPPKAILDKPITQNDGRKTHIEMDKCFPEFSDNYGCSICVKECMFNRVGYKKLKEQFNKKVNK
ncbi:MAG: epoxyqueuosine reductase [Asgard group archaeon]|nr:epoxyqueuosine reductase [Asgard group archaeon]